uniref:Microsomal glutathione S-transferase 2 n=1 Tax=Ictidomys tridecemlineatus TaxID=43179 RepID=A0A287D2D0_ICTTR
MAGNTFLQAVVSSFSTCQQNYFALQVGKMGLKCRIIPPAVTGSPKFERMFRAHFCRYFGTGVHIWPSQVLLGICRSY